MASQWRVVDLSSFEGEVRSERGAVAIIPECGERVVLPVAELAVVLIGMKAVFTAAALHRLVQADVAVLLCDWRGVPEAGAYMWSDHGRVGARHRAQAKLSLPRGKNAWARIVRAKIEGQANALANLGYRGSGELFALADQVRSGDPGNVEAQAARLYWSRAMDKGMGRQPSSGALLGSNACLDYGYTVLRGYAMRAVLAAGLCSALGVFHHGRANMFALADDIIEPFRPCVDEVALSLPSTASPSDPEVKRVLVAAAGQKFTKNGLGVAAVMEDLAQRYGRYVEGDEERLSVPVWEGPTTVCCVSGSDG